MSRSNFQRSQSKVWWGNEPEHQLFFTQPRETLPVYQEHEEEDELNKTPEKKIANSWSNRQGSPASHKSQDSGFSDSEISPNMPHHVSSDDKNFQQSSPDKLTPKMSVNNQINEHLYQRSPSINSEIDTPPTVIRRVTQEIRTISDLVSRRISYSEPSSPTYQAPEIDLISKIDSLNYSNTSPLTSSRQESPNSPCKCSRDRSIKRSRVITKNSKVKRNLNQQLTSSNEVLETSFNGSPNQTLLDENTSINSPKSILKPSPSAYNNETVYFGTTLDSTLKDETKDLPTYSDLYPNGTSTPIMYNPKMYRSLPSTPTRVQRSTTKLRPTKLLDNFFPPAQSPTTESSPYSFTQYTNPQLNGHTPAVQFWLDSLRQSYQPEVMSILQTKSISVEAARNIKLTSATSVKLIRHIQSKVVTLQNEFEKVEKIFKSEFEEDFHHLPPLVQSLAGNVYDFIHKQQGNNFFGSDKSDGDYRKFHENTRSLQDMTTDLRIAAANFVEFDIKAIEEDVQIIKRYFLITIRLIFKSLIKIIVDTIEESKCDLILRSNLSYIAMLSNLDYSGLASLNDAFISNGAVRALLIVCIESRYSSIRALALRALATVCSTTETIRQLEKADGIEILKDILVDQKSSERTEPEFRETISVLTQITAPWHGEDHKIDGLKNYIHSLVEAISDIADKTSCCQTLLLCSACLNNLTRIESTAIYSLMSHETIFKLKNGSDKRGPGASIFLYEQITSMLFNMSSNKKSHHHLANRNVINFLIQIFNQKFYEDLPSRAENDASKKTIKNVLHIFSRLMNASIVGQDVLENNIIPIFSRVERSLDNNSEYFRDITYINKKFNDSLSFKTGNINNNTPPVENRNKIVLLDKNRQESYV